MIGLSCLGFWFALSVLNQFRRGYYIRPFKKRDLFGLIPIWTFFAPNPGRTDLHVLVRDIHENGTTPWRELEAGRAKPNPIMPRLLWNPEKRISKMHGDWASSVMRLMGTRGRRRKTMMLSLPYLLLVRSASFSEPDFRARARQFALARSPGPAGIHKTQVILVSSPHHLE